MDLSLGTRAHACSNSCRLLEVVVTSDGEDFTPLVEPALVGHCMEGFLKFVCSVRSLDKM